MGSISGAIVHGIAAVGVFLAHITYSSSIHLRIALMVICSLAGVGASLYSGVNAPNIAASVGCVVMTSSQYVLRGARMRQGFLAGEAVFFVFAVLVGSIPGMLVTITNSFAGLIGLFRSRHLEAQQATTAIS
jgi:Bacterial inner membrane protein.